MILTGSPKIVGLKTCPLGLESPTLSAGFQGVRKKGWFLWVVCVGHPPMIVFGKIFTLDGSPIIPIWLILLGPLCPRDGG